MDQPGPGSNAFVAAARRRGVGTEVALVDLDVVTDMKVLTPLSMYETGQAMTAKPPNSLPLAM